MDESGIKSDKVQPVTKNRCSGLAILLCDNYTNQRGINSEDNSEDSAPVLKEVEL